MSTRSRKQNNVYRKYLKNNKSSDCIFCEINNKFEQQLQETKYFKVIKNIYSYTLWDGVAVEDHLMIVPKKHTDTLSDLSSVEAKEFVDLLGRYEKAGYNVYARAPDSVRKTVVHQHTHLIKINGKVRRLIFTIYRPFYFRVHG